MPRYQPIQCAAGCGDTRSLRLKLLRYRQYGLLVGEGDGEAVGAAMPWGAAAAGQSPSFPFHLLHLQRALSKWGRFPCGAAHGGHLPLGSVT